jgi:general secretion pathway protein G
VIYLRELRLNRIGRGDTVAVKLTDRRVALSERGFTLIELVITITVLTILTMGVMPLIKVSVKRQKEQQLRDYLRQMRTAIDEFHRDTVGINCTGATLPPGTPPPPGTYLDPRSKVVVSDCTIFGVDNPDRYPPTLETLVDGVNVIPRATRPPDINTPPSELGQLSTKKKVYLRGIPIDPMTGKADWEFSSCYDSPDSGSWGGENVFDVRSNSKDKALNGDKYSDW